MAILLLALYAEGSVDRQFLPLIAQRTSVALLALYGETIIDVPETVIIPKRYDSLDQCILHAAHEARGYHALLVHNDGDNLTYDGALQQRFLPGFDLVKQTSKDVCRKLVPIIPVRMTEAWMLADTHTLCQVLGTDLDPQKLGLPGRISQVETIARPKDTINEVIRIINSSNSRRRRAVNLSTRYELLARMIDLNKLLELPSYKKFISALAEALEDLHLISHGSTSKITNNVHFITQRE